MDSDIYHELSLLVERLEEVEKKLKELDNEVGVISEVVFDNPDEQLDN